MRYVVIALTIVVFAIRPTAQTATFDAASIKRAAPSADNRMGVVEGIPTEVRFLAAPLTMIVSWAYGEQFVPWTKSVFGLPDWAERDRYDILAKVGGSATLADRRRMMQALLAERFGLAVHRENREFDVLVLKVAQPSTGLPRGLIEVTCERGVPPTENGLRPCALNPRRDGAESTGSPMADLTNLIASFSRERVVDETQLNGRYKFTLRFSQVRQVQIQDVPDGLPELGTALTEQIGLRLVPEKRRIPVLVVDRVHVSTPD